MLLLAILFAFAGAAFSYLYIQNFKLTPISFEEFLNNPLRLFSRENFKNEKETVFSDKSFSGIKLDTNEFHTISNKNQNNSFEKNLLPAPADYEDNQISTTLDFNTENDRELSRFSSNNLLNGLPFMKPNINSKTKEISETAENYFDSISDLIKSNQLRKNDDPLIEPKHLLTLQITKRKICLFEVGTSEPEQSR